MQTRKITSPLSLIFLISTLASIGVHYYLTNEHINLKYGIGEGSPTCNISETFNCSTAIISNYSEIWGIPLGIFGMFVNMVILFFGIKALVFNNKKTANSARVALSFALLAVAASVVMGGISLFILHSGCPVCMSAYVLSIITLVTLCFAVKPVLKTPAGDVWKPLLMAAVFVGIGSFTYSAMALKDYNSKEVREILSIQATEWKNAQPSPPELTEPLKFGPDMAKMKVVEFADFLCPHCAHAYGKLHTFAKANPQVQILFQAFPLDGCSGPAENPGLRCQLAMTAYCAEKQGKGWGAQAYLFHNQQKVAEAGSITATIAEVSAETGANKDQIDACIREPATLEVIKKQMENGKKAGVEGTPSIWINDKKFRGGLHLPLLKELYDQL